MGDVFLRGALEETTDKLIVWLAVGKSGVPIPPSTKPKKMVLV